MLGVLVIPLSYLAFRPSLGQVAALWVAGLVATAYLLIDFSGNGSLWILITVFYLLFVWRAAAAPIIQPRNAVVLGIIIGLAFLVNYPASVLAPVLVLTALLQFGRKALSSTMIRSIAIAAAAALLVVLPWFAFNALLHGNPLWSQPLQRQLGGGDTRADVRVVDGEVIKIRNGCRPRQQLAYAPRQRISTATSASWHDRC